MYHGVHSRHRPSVRWAVEAGVPIGTSDAERRPVEASEKKSSGSVAADGLKGVNKTDLQIPFPIEPTLDCTRRDLAQEASETSLPPIAPASPLVAFPQLFSESDLECPLCCRLLYQPITTRCGHSYCKGCFMTAMQYSSNCPLCRQILNVNQTGKTPVLEDYSVSFVLASLIEKSFPKKYAERCEETIEEEAERKITLVTTTVTPVVEEPDSCWDSSTFFSNCLGSGCFVLD